MCRFIAFLILFLVLQYGALSQTGELSGVVRNIQTNETMVGVNVLVDSATGISTGVKGEYVLKLDAGQHTVTYTYIGYISQLRDITIKEGSKHIIDITMVPETIELDVAVVSAGKFEQKLSDVTVSMEIMKPEFIENNQTISMETAINKIPGVDVAEKQASIRGGGGYSFGAGSRVMVLVDDLPMLTADVNEVKWNFLPVENVEQVEILKGASSSLYGSSALNGVINFRTATPGNEPVTKFAAFSGIYNKPKRDELSWWWDTYPLFAGASFSHLRKIGDVDLVVGANAFSNPGYRMDNFEERVRLNVGVKHRPKKIKGFSYGLNTNFQVQNTSDFLIWLNADSGAFIQNPDVISPTRGARFNIDPYVTYYYGKGNRHSLRTRFYRTYNKFKENEDKNNGSDLYYAEYQYHKTFENDLNWTIGSAGSYAETNANLFGDHFSSTIAFYSQLDKKFFNRLSVSLGLRWERYTLDNTKDDSKPVARAGLSYQAAEYTFIRASFGQGYRFPSIAEMYTSTSLGNLNIFPNPDLKAETSWSTELGVRQGLKMANWNGYLDAALFWSEYEDMIEFTFGVYIDDSTTIPTLDNVGFKSLNIGNARITGLDLVFGGAGSFGSGSMNFFVGYTYMNPLDLSADTLENDILKYRFRHSFKGDMEFIFNRFSTGLNFVYTSHVERIDEAFEDKILGKEIFPGLKKYREENDKGSVVFDFRMAYQVSNSSRLSLFIKNIFNAEYMSRPGDIQPPRSISLQYSLNI